MIPKDQGRSPIPDKYRDRDIPSENLFFVVFETIKRLEGLCVGVEKRSIVIIFTANGDQPMLVYGGNHKLILRYPELLWLRSLIPFLAGRRIFCFAVTSMPVVTFKSLGLRISLIGILNESFFQGSVLFLKLFPRRNYKFIRE